MWWNLEPQRMWVQLCVHSALRHLATLVMLSLNRTTFSDNQLNVIAAKKVPFAVRNFDPRSQMSHSLAP